VQVVIGGTDYKELVQWRDILMQRMQENPDSRNPSNYEERKPQARCPVDRQSRADLGVSLQTVGARSRPCSARAIVTTFIDRDREYK